MEFSENEIEVCFAGDVSSSLLNDFFQTAFPNRAKFLESNWRWLNRSAFYNNKTPLVLVYKKQVIGYAGMIPFSMAICGEVQKTAWFIDFKFLPEYQRKGLGSILAKAWMSYSDCFVGSSANEKSVGILTKNHWIESPNSFMHLNLIRPFNYPKFRKVPSFLRFALNAITSPIFHFYYSKYSYSENSYQLIKFNEETFYEFFNNYEKAGRITNNVISPVRDINYFIWRVLDSPNSDKYYIYKTDKYSALILIENDNEKCIDILLVSDLNNKEELKKMICTLGVYGLKNGFSYVRFYTSKPELSSYIKSKTKSIVRHPRFVYLSFDEMTKEKIASADWEFELIDSDFEHFHTK